jgi:hypothetical protein
MEAETAYQQSRWLAKHRHSDVAATLKLLNEIILLSQHVVNGPTLPDSDVWPIQACTLWSRTMHALKDVFRIRSAQVAVPPTQAEQICRNLHYAIAQHGFNRIRSVIKENKRRRIEDPRTSSVLAVHVAGVIQTHSSSLKVYLEDAHSWNQFEFHKCNCCASLVDLQQQCINRLSSLQTVNITWGSGIQG